MPTDTMVLGHEIGTSKGQQTWESLVVLVSLRHWKSHWQRAQCTLEIKSDSVSALALASKLKSGGRGPNIVAREMALDLSGSPFRPQVFTHVPGVSNISADVLSRRYQPGVEFRTPVFL